MSVPTLKLWGWFHKHRVGLVLGGIIVIAVFFRFWKLDSLPPGLHPDEAANGLDIVQRILHGDIRPLYDTNGPREALFFYIQTIFVVLMGNTILALRIAPALIGTVAVFMTYLLTKEWFSKRAGLFAALFMASGSWSVTIGRDGFRANMVPLMLVLVAYFVTKALKTKRLKWWLLAGVAYGAGWYTYIAWQITPLLIVVLIGFALFRFKGHVKPFIKPFMLAMIAAMIVMVPMAIYGVHHPGEVIGGRSSVSFTNPSLNHGQPLKTLLETIGKTALMFNWRGDPNYRQNLGGAPQLNAFVGIMFLLGILACLRKLKDPRYFTLLMAFGTMLIPEIATAEGIPHGLRAIGAIPAVYILASVGLVLLIDRWRAVFPKNPSALAAMFSLLGLVMLLALVYDYQRYFVAWANDPNTFDAYNEGAVAMANYANDHITNGPLYIVIDGYTNNTVQYLLYHKTNYTRVDKDKASQIPIKPGETIISVPDAATSVMTYLDNQNSTFNDQKMHSTKRPGVLLFNVFTIK